MADNIEIILDGKIKKYKKRSYSRCDICGHIFAIWEDRIYGNDKVMCIDCALKTKQISGSMYLDMQRYPFNDKARVCIYNGKVEVAPYGEKFSFKKTNGDYRRNREYKEWRENVFERDNYTCQKCGRVGGELNAHHIKPFKDYPKLRYEITNGITLCIECHRKEHKKGE